MNIRRSTRPAALLAIVGLASASHAQPIAWNTLDGDWSIASNWLPANVPNTTSETAVLGGVNAYFVDLDASHTILATEITNPLAVLRVSTGFTLTLQGASINNGTININPQGSSTNAALTFSTNPILLSGTGQIRMLSGSDNAQLLTINGSVLTQAATHSIRGVGIIGAALNNLGAVTADGSIALNGDTLLLNTNAKTNSGVLAAAPGSTLAISGIAITQTPTGQIRPDGGTVSFASASLSGGQIVGTSTYVTQSGTSTFTDVTLNADGQINPATLLAVAGNGLTNNETLSVNPAGSASNAVLRFDATGTLGGTGEVRLATGSDNAQVTTAAGVTLTQGPDHTIRGVGLLTSTLVNNGEIWADESAAVNTDFTLAMQVAPVTNNNTIGARTDSTLAISGIQINQGGGGELVADGGTITFASAGLTAGSIEATGAGSWASISGTTTFTGVTANAPGLVNPGTTLAAAGSGLTNNALLVVNPTGSASNSTVRFDASGTLGGTGELRLRAGSTNAQLATAAGVTITHAPSHTIRGVGAIPAALVNNGSIFADNSVAASGSGLILQTAGKTNNALIQANTGSTLTVSGITIDQTGGGQLRVDGGTINFSSATLLGGQITTSGAGNWAVVSGTNPFNSVTSNVPGQVNAGASLTVNGSGLTNNAEITINPGGSSTNAHLTFNASGTLGGTGRIILVGGSDNAQISSSSDVNVAHAATHSIHGDGVIGMAAGSSFTNHGLLSPGPVAGGIADIVVNGSFTNGPTGVFEVELAGSGTANADRLIGAGAYTLGGTLDVSLTGGYVPSRQHTARIIAGASVAGRFDTVLKPALPAGVALRVVYLSNAVDVWFHCPPDLTTGAIAGQPGYGVPNGVLNNDDFFFYLNLFSSGDPDADLSTGAIPGQPGYGVPNGLVNNEDFFYYLGIFSAGCTP